MVRVNGDESERMLRAMREVFGVQREEPRRTEGARKREMLERRREQEGGGREEPD